MIFLKNAVLTGCKDFVIFRNTEQRCSGQRFGLLSGSHAPILDREGITATGIAIICHGSPSSVIRIIDEAVELKSRVARLPENLCFDEFRSVNSTMSFICCDAEGSHDIVAILENRLTKTIREHFMNRYTNQERAAVKSAVVDLNTQYIKFIKALFPNARIIIDRFHIVQLVLTASSMISPTVRLKE